MKEWIEEVENTGTADVVEALRACVEQLKRLSAWDYLWARARETAAGDLVAAVDGMRADVRRLVSLFGELEGEGAIPLTVCGAPLAEAERIMAKTIVHSNLSGDLKVVVEHCDHEGMEWVRVSLGNRRYIYLCPMCAGLMRWEVIKALVKEASTVHSFSATAHVMGGPAGE